MTDLLRIILSSVQTIFKTFIKTVHIKYTYVGVVVNQSRILVNRSILKIIVSNDYNNIIIGRRSTGP